VVDASSAKVTRGDRTLVGPLLCSSADAGIGGHRWSARGGRARDGGIRTAVVGVNAGGVNAGGWRRSRRRVGRATLGKADNLGTSDDKSIEKIGPDVGPLKSNIHSREGNKFTG